MKSGHIPSVMTHRFSEVPKVNIPRSSFDRSHGIKTTFDSGYLIPIMVDEALPGDTFKVKLTAFARMATPIYPVMDNVYLDVFHFAVPMRLVWDNFTKFMGEQIDPGDSIDYTVPTYSTTGTIADTNFDYFGLPTVNGNIYLHSSALPARALHLVYNQWFRDENLQDSLIVDTDDGPDNHNDYKALIRRGKRHDYFTSAMPWAQKGDSVDLPLGTTAPVISTGDGIPEFQIGGNNGYNLTGSVGFTNTDWNPSVSPGGSASWDDTKLIADLTTATAATINQLREAFSVQALLERDSRGGTRYPEIVLSHFGVTTPTAGWRSEYLGGGSQMVNISPIAQTSSTDATSPQANLAAMGTVSLNNNGYTKSFTEHTILLSLVNIRADLTYQQGLNRMWSRSTRYDFYWPSLANLGEQGILNKEIFYNNDANDDLIFGYQERWAEYRYKPSIITGKFRSNATGTLDSWHLSQDFATLPALNAAFIEDDPPIDRVVAVPSEPQWLFDGYFNMQCVRPMPLYGVPGQGGHF
jgi:hypothetical protein